VRAPSPWQWRLLLAAALLLVALWPPVGGRSLAAQAVNWAADPAGTLPVLPAQLPVGMGDDVAAVDARDAMVRAYDAAWDEGGLTQLRLRLKSAREPLPPATLRQLILAAAVVLAAVAWRVAAGPADAARTGR
jgi:hypothetical protein